MTNTTNNEHDLMWCHEGSALAALMLQEGYDNVLCDISKDDEGYAPVFIVSSLDVSGEYMFKDENGKLYTDAQPIFTDGTAITYQQYLLMKQG